MTMKTGLEDEYARLQTSLAIKNENASRASRVVVGAKVEVRFGVLKHAPNDHGERGTVVSLGECSGGKTARVKIAGKAQTVLVFVDQLFPVARTGAERSAAARERAKAPKPVVIGSGAVQPPGC